MFMADSWAGIAVIFVVSHFFLFCNVFRMARSLEFIWAGTFASLAIATVVFDWISWPTVLVGSTALTALLVVIEIRKPPITASDGGSSILVFRNGGRALKDENLICAR